MNRRSLARRYAPLAAVVAIQLLIIATVPSRAPESTEVATSTAEGAYGTPVGGETEGVPGAPGGAMPGDPGSPPAGDVGAPGAPGTPTAAGGTARPGTAVKPAAGSTAHCIAGRQFDPAIDFYAPPCVPRFTGNNGGATYLGVTGVAIKIIDYYDRGNDAVNEILKQTGGYVSIDQQRIYDKAVEKFINDRFELYGRKVSIETFQGTCQSIPPDIPCLRKEMDDMIAAKKPFAVKWSTSLCSACFDELSQKKVLNVGGFSFRDEFSNARRPYHWDVQQSGTKIAKAWAQFYCANLHGKPAKFAQDKNPANPINGRPRVLGVIATNDPENQGAIEQMKVELAKCGAKVSHEYYYAQDITTAEQQRAAGVGAMREDPESTTVLCFCDEVAPQFLYGEEHQQGYWPENVIAGAEFMDTDPAGQSYSASEDGSPSLACPAPQQGCEYHNVFGLASQAIPPEALGKDAGARVWKAGGGQGDVPFESVTREWDYLSLVAHLIQAAGPNLTPANAEAGITRAPAVGGGATGRVRRSVGRGNYAWNQDMQVVYWARNRPSPFNGKKGTYVAVSGRIELGGYRPTDLNFPNPDTR